MNTVFLNILDIIIKFGIPIFVFCSSILFVWLVYHIIKHIIWKKTNDETKKAIVDNLLSSFSEKNTPVKDAEIFEDLVYINYIKIHKILNDGCKYNDEKQTASFKKSLTDEVIYTLNNLNGEIR